LQTDLNRDQIQQLARTASGLLFIDTPTVTADNVVYYKLFTSYNKNQKWLLLLASVLSPANILPMVAHKL